jgi:hypothetical protein
VGDVPAFGRGPKQQSRKRQEIKKTFAGAIAESAEYR